jgi:hypothetical protein
MRNAPSRYLHLTQDRSILHEFTGCLHLAEGLETIDEFGPPRRPASWLQVRILPRSNVPGRKRWPRR